MGLDITAYSKLRISDNQTFTADGEPLAGEDCIQLYQNYDFPGRADEFPHKIVCHVDGKKFDINAGSYGRYNAWREKLAALAGYALGSYERYGGKLDSYAATVWDNPIQGPFMELICFSDCEGTIGTAVSAKLAKDFADFQEKCNAHEDKYFREKYTEWRKAFELAADSGAVRFH